MKNDSGFMTGLTAPLTNAGNFLFVHRRTPVLQLCRRRGQRRIEKRHQLQQSHPAGALKRGSGDVGARGDVGQRRMGVQVAHLERLRGLETHARHAGGVAHHVARV